MEKNKSFFDYLGSSLKKGLYRFRYVTIFLTVAVGFLIIYILFSDDIRVRFYDPCVEAKEIYQFEANGIITFKKTSGQLDRNISVFIEQWDGEEKYLNLLHESKFHSKTGRSFFWETVNVGDSIRKEPGTFRVYYKKKTEGKWYFYDLGFKLCED
jgi:hypothetical protein